MSYKKGFSGLERLFIAIRQVSDPISYLLFLNVSLPNKIKS